MTDMEDMLEITSTVQVPVSEEYQAALDAFFVEFVKEFQRLESIYKYGQHDGRTMIHSWFVQGLDKIANSGVDITLGDFKAVAYLIEEAFTNEDDELTNSGDFN
jgi:hypothetical protein